MLKGHVQFGVAGYPPNFFKSNFKNKRENIFEWIKSLNLDWIELQNTYGIKMPDEQAILYRKLAQQNGIGISIHAPYFITLASGDEEIRKRSKERIVQAFALAEKLDSKRIIFHPGHYPDKTDIGRKSAINLLIKGLKDIQHDIPTNKDIYLYAETIGKKSQIGSLDEIINISSEIDFCLPCLDIAHIHAFELGTLKSMEAIYNVIEKVKTALGHKIDNKWHFHMYPVDFDDKGEKGHKAFSDRKIKNQLSMFDNEQDDFYYPQAEHFTEAIAKNGLSGVVVCEAKDSQDTGALLLKEKFGATI